MKCNADDFWDRVNAMIKKKGLTQASLSSTCGFNQRRIQNLSAGSRFPDADECFLMAGELGTTVEFLFTGKETVNAPEITENTKLKIINFISSL